MPHSLCVLASSGPEIGMSKHLRRRPKIFQHKINFIVSGVHLTINIIYRKFNLINGSSHKHNHLVTLALISYQDLIHST